MKIKFSIQKDGRTLSSRDFDVIGTASFQIASAEIWRMARDAYPTPAPKNGEFLWGLDDLWGASMQLSPPDDPRASVARSA